MLRYHHYMLAMTAEAAEAVVPALRIAIEREPEYGPAWSALANVSAHAYVWDAPAVTDPLATAMEYAHKGAALEPASQLTRTIMAYVHLLRGERRAVLDEAGMALSLNPNSPYFAGTIGYLLVLAGDFERGRTLVERAIAQNPCHPSWFRHACWLDDYRQGQYEASYRHASAAGPQLGFWNPVLCAASLGQLGRVAEAQAFVGELRRLKPDFEPRARELIHRMLTIEDLVDRIVEGLRQSGLAVE
jgi:tetratricopeptide (TPR) repeat protein